VTTAIISPVQASAGVGFAIPAAIVDKVVPELIEAGYYEHPWLGISATSLSPDLAKAMGLEPDQRGALVVDVVPESPADKAGLRGSDRQVNIDGEQVRVGGDVITGIDGQPVKEFDDVVTYLARATEIGQTVALTLLREGKEIEAKAILAARPQTQKQAKQTETGAGDAWLGILGMTLTGEIAEAMGLPSDQKGVLVEQVYSGSPADEAGLRGSYKPITIEGRRILVGGDIILALDGEAVKDLEELQDLLQKRIPGEEVALTVLRDGVETQVSLTLGERPG
jgi:serine protease Do